jgi:hypothetical protein
LRSSAKLCRKWADLFSLSADAPESERGEVSRNLLLLLATDERTERPVGDAIERAQLAAIPLLLLPAALLFVLTTNFRIERKIVDGKAQTTWSVSRKASSAAQLRLLFHPTQALEQLAGIFPGRQSGSPQAGNIAGDKNKS